MKKQFETVSSFTESQYEKAGQKLIDMIPKVWEDIVSKVA